MKVLGGVSLLQVNDKKKKKKEGWRKGGMKNSKLPYESRIFMWYIYI